MAQVGAPVGRFDFILNQVVDGFGVGDAQQGFRQAHQADALFGRETVLGEKTFHHRRAGLASHALDRLRAGRGDGLAFGRAQADRSDQFAHHRRLVRGVIIAHGDTAIGAVPAARHFGIVHID